MPADVIWPDGLKPTAGKAKVMAATTGGGRSLSGLEQVIASDAGYWRITLAGIRITNNEQLRAWNAIEAILQGRSGTVLVPLLDCHRAPWPTVDGELLTSYGQIPHSDNSLFSDGTGYYQPVIMAEAEAAIAARATAGRIRMVVAGELLPGTHFSAGEYAYRIKTVDIVSTDGDEIVYAVTFWPPARESIAAGDALDFEHPRVRARLETDEEMDFDPYLLKQGGPTLNFVEDTP